MKALKILVPGYVRGNSKVDDVVIGEFTDAEVKRFEEMKVAKRTGLEESEQADSRVLLTTQTLSDASVEEVEAYVQSGQWDAATVQALEGIGKKRAGILSDPKKGKDDGKAKG